MTLLHTPRLLLRRWHDEDSAPMAAINADPEVMRWISDGSVQDKQQTRAFVHAVEEHWQTHGFGLFAVQRRDTAELIGFAGLSIPHFLPEVMPAVEVGWRLGRPYWGHGLATEAARAVLRFAFVARDLDRVISIIQVGNDASERIAAKLEMTVERSTTEPTQGRPIRVHALTRSHHLATSASPDESAPEHR